MSLTNIHELFIGPLLSLKPGHMTDIEYIEWLLCVKTRTIIIYRVDKTCSIPGVYLDGGVHPNANSNVSRKASGRSLIIARYDEVLNIYDVDYKGHVWRLTKYQWRSFRQNLMENKLAGDI